MEPPYYAVIFTSVRTAADDAGYAAMAAEINRLAAEQPGYLGIEAARNAIGITVSYWRDLDAIRAWRSQVDHLAAQRQGRELWYGRYRVRIARVEREYGFEAG